MKEALFFLGVVMVASIMVGLIAFGNMLGQRTHTINCSIAEFSPDFTPAMREACRNLRKESK